MHQSTEEEEEDYEDDEEEDQFPCTYAATGNHPSYQPVYICRTCHPASPSPEEETKKIDQESAINEETTKPNELPLCICESCAQSCHGSLGHNVEFLGVGPCYCDCSTGCSSSDNNTSDNNHRCKLMQDSLSIANKLGIRRTQRDVFVDAPAVKEENDSLEGEETSCSFPYVADVHTISKLDTDVCRRLRRQAVELVKHSTDTHWIPARIEGSGDDCCHSKENNLCELESLAHAIFVRHVKHYGLDEEITRVGDSDSSSSSSTSIAGAEWWVQIKPSSTGQETENNNTEPNAIDNSKSLEAVDLHYDKDETLAESFGLGSFPTLSTVTYLTEHDVSLPASPTVVFPHTYHEDEDEIITDVVVSHPKQGKHLVFDGRLLHGAPSHPALRGCYNPIMDVATASAAETNSSSSSVQDMNLRVTFLVNIWISGRPSGVPELSDDIRSNLLKAATGQSSSLECERDWQTVDMEKKPIPVIAFNNPSAENGAAPETTVERIHLPFVSSGATWIDDDDDEDDGNDLILSMFPPPTHTVDTVRIAFGNDMEARLEHLNYIEE